MNIKITYSWLLEYLETDADPYELQKYLSLCGPSIETVEKVDGDYVFDIEITSNRIDMASVYGIAQEAAAILPQFGKKAKLIKHNFIKPQAPTKDLSINITDSYHLTNRVLAVVLDNVIIGKSPEYIQKRLKLAGIRTLNNVVDVTNYIMLELGHPTHIFDYDRIAKQKLIFRESKKGEKIISLEDKTYTLYGGDSIIEDGDGRIIDLPGIIGTSNSIVVDSTKRLLFFIDNNDPVQMRKTSMNLGIRTVAATYNEKSPDPERAFDSLLLGIELLQKNSGAKVASSVIDIYPQKKLEKHVRVYLKDIQRIIGVSIEETPIISILEKLGFGVNRSENDELAYPDGVSFDILVPSFRYNDVSIKEDIIEEVSRVYGYHNLPSKMAPLVYIKQPKDIENLFKVQTKSKYYLKHIGLHEYLNYSMISGDLIDKLRLVRKDYLRIKNSISSEIEYMRNSLIPSLIKNIKENSGKKDKLEIFELAKTYTRKDDQLPDEKYYLGFATNSNFADLKGVIDSLFYELNITDYDYENNNHSILNNSAKIKIHAHEIGVIGSLKQELKIAIDVPNDIFVAELDFETIANQYKVMGSYKKISPYAVIKLDSTIMSPLSFSQIKTIAKLSSSYLQNIELLDQYEGNITIRLHFTSYTENLTENTAKNELASIITSINNKKSFEKQSCHI